MRIMHTGYSLTSEAEEHNRTIILRSTGEINRRKQKLVHLVPVRVLTASAEG